MRKICAECKFIEPNPRGWQWDWCLHKGAARRHRSTPLCAEVRRADDECGRDAKWFHLRKVAA